MVVRVTVCSGVVWVGVMWFVADPKYTTRREHVQHSMPTGVTGSVIAANGCR